jgi:predicted amidohydrolase YtcJ
MPRSSPSKGAWILGGEWIDSLWGGHLPSRQWLDSLAPDHPVWLINADGNTGIANAAALRAAGMAGEGTGVIRGGPMWRMDAAIIERTRERDDRVMQAGIAKLIRTGVTSVHHNNGWPEFLILKRLHEAGKLPLRVYSSPSFPGWERLRDYIAEYGRGDEWLHWELSPVGSRPRWRMVKVAFGSDSSPWISGVIAPVESLQIALERTAPDGTRITLDEALRAFTVDAAYAEFAEKDKGSLQPGKLADFVLFDRDFSRVPVHAISAAKVRMTVIGGHPAFVAE